LIEKCYEGDEYAQMKLYKLYYKNMYNTSLRIINNAVEAEDVMQEAFLSAFTKIHTYKGEVSFGAWLKRIVINKSLDHVKKKKIEFAELNDSIYYIKEENTAEEYENEKEQLDKIKKAIKMLPDGYRIILSLYLIEGFDHDEIAQILKIKNSTSRSQLTRAKVKLSEIVNTL
jgi:RNA polymerase sigma-70 factor (ECF subfamily)